MEDSFIECSDFSQLKGIHEDAEFTARYIERNDLEQSVEME